MPWMRRRVLCLFVPCGSITSDLPGGVSGVVVWLGDTDGRRFDADFLERESGGLSDFASLVNN